MPERPHLSSLKWTLNTETKAKWQSLERQTEKPIQETCVDWDSFPFLTLNPSIPAHYFGALVLATPFLQFPRASTVDKTQPINGLWDINRRKCIYQENRQVSSSLFVCKKRKRLEWPTGAIQTLHVLTIKLQFINRNKLTGTLCTNKCYFHCQCKDTAWEQQWGKNMIYHYFGEKIKDVQFHSPLLNRFKPGDWIKSLPGAVTGKKTPWIFWEKGELD